MSMQGGDTQGQVVEQLQQAQQQGTGEPQQQTGQGSQQQQQQSSEYSLAGDFLKNIPDNERPIVEKYVKQWDAGVTRRFQDLHGKYKPFEVFGELDPEVIPQIHKLYELATEAPEQLYALLHEEFGQQQSQQQQQPLQTQQVQQQNTPGTETLQGLPPELQDVLNPVLNPLQSQLQQQHEALQTIAQVLLQDRQSKQQSEEDAQFDQYMDLLHQEFGDFDDDYVIFQMANGKTGEDAVQAFRAISQQQVNQAMNGNQQAPVVISGGGAVLTEQQSITDLSNKETKDLVANIMQRVHEGS